MSIQAESVDGDSSASDGSPSQPYVGLITRGIAFVLDAALINLLALLVAVAAALIASIFHFPSLLKAVIEVVGAVAYVAWSIAYLVGFWSTTGQTPGCRVMGCRVVRANGERVGWRRGVVRCVGLLLAALPLFAGYLLIPIDRQRRGFQDRLARTLVVEARFGSAAPERRLERPARQTAGSPLEPGYSSARTEAAFRSTLS